MPAANTRLTMPHVFPSSTFDADVAIIGAGPVGLALAGWLAQRSTTRQLSVVLLDAREPDTAAADPRAIALSQGSWMLLNTLVWPADAVPIKRIHISQQGHFGRALIDHDEYRVAALGYVARYGSIMRALTQAVHTTSTRWLASTRVCSPQQDIAGVTLVLESAQGPQQLRTRIAISAEGGLFHETNQHHHGCRRDYAQTALIGTVTASAPQPHTAWERFTCEGPLALLPLGGARHADYALVWCCAPEVAQRRAQLADADFLRELGAAFGTRMGTFTAITGRTSFPLGLNAAERLVNSRIAAIGNAAQTLHPVAGQGLNLGLRDARTLAETLAEHGATPIALAAFGSRRQLDRRVTIGMTDALARCFTTELGPFASLRSAALTALECVPPLKAALARQMMFGQRR